jgi:tetrapyrrole methylase family protein/MazG family protein
MHGITVVTISTGDASLLTQAAVAALTDPARTRVLRTARHPVAAWLAARGLAFASLDDLYEHSEDFDALAEAAVKRLLALAHDSEMIYAVPDPATDATLAALRGALPRGMKLAVLAGVSHADRCLAMMDDAPAGVRLYAAEAFQSERVSPCEALLLTELHSRACAGACKLKLMRLLPEDAPVAFFTGDANGALSLRTVPLYALDRQPAYDHLTACCTPALPMAQRKRFDMDDLVAVMARLRAPDGCPWDREQTHESLLTYLLEECYEYIGAVREADVDHMYDELGDVLLQVVFHAEIARQHGTFDIEDVTTAIVQKMVERHTHIFGAAKADTAAQVLSNWDAIKRSQRGITTHAQAMEDVSGGLSATMRADKVQRKAAKVKFDFPDALSALAKVYEEADEVRQCLTQGEDPEMELGDLLFAAVNVCRLLKKNPDIALFSSTDKFIDRFRKMENSIRKAGKSIEHLTLSEMDVYWEAEKQAQPTNEG